MNRLFLSYLFFLSTLLHLHAQDNIQIVRLSTWSEFDVLDPYVLIYIDSLSHAGDVPLNSFAFKRPAPNALNETVSRSLANVPHYYKVLLHNDTPDTANYFILAAPQKYFQSYKKSGESYEPLPMEWHKQKNTLGAKIAKFTLLPDEKAEVVIKLIFPFYNEGYVYLWMAPQSRVREFFTYRQAAVAGNTSFQWLACGMLLMMFLYIMLKYVQLRTLDYLYYGIYIFFFLMYFGLKLLSSIGYEQIYYNDWYGGLFNNQVQVYAYIMYFLFFQSFLNTKHHMPRLHRLFKLSLLVLLAYIVVDTMLFFFPQFFLVKNLLWNLIRLSLVALTFTAIILILKSKSPLGNYLVVGGIILTVFGLAAMIFSFDPAPIASLPSPFDTPLNYFQIGVVGELIAFTLGLGYKNRMDEQEKVRAQAKLQAITERQEFERYRAMMDAREEERARIAKDLHDGVGGLLSGVKMSLTQMQDRLAPQSDDKLVFARSLDMLDGSMQEIRRVAHAMMPPSLQQFGLNAAVRDFVEAINSMKTIDVVFQVVGDDKQSLTLDKQLIIYRIIQELVNNVLKHSHADKCIVQLVYGDTLSITVEDNGTGFEKSNNSGAGLQNIRQRVEFLKGSIDWDSTPGNGTSVTAEIPLR